MSRSKQGGHGDDEEAARPRTPTDERQNKEEHVTLHREATFGDAEEHRRPSRLLQVAEFSIEAVIILNAIQMGVCTHPEDSDELYVGCMLSEHFFTAVFFLEFIMKRWRLGTGYWADKWNWLDFSLVVVAVVDGWIISPIMSTVNSPFRNILIIRLLRINRLLRLLKMISARQEMKLLLLGLRSAFQSMIWMALLLGLLIYCAAILCVVCFRDVDMNGTDVNFTTIPHAMFAMFTIAILGDWSEIICPVIAEFWWAAIFFIFFVFIATFGILNLIIGVITEKNVTVQAEHQKYLEYCEEEHHMEGVQEVAKVLFSTQDDDTITREEMEAMVNSDEYGAQIHHLVKDVDLPAGYEVTDCHAMFDRDSSGTITQEEFSDGMRRLIFGNSFQRSFMIQAAIADVMVFTKGFEDRMTAQLTSEFARLRQELGMSPVERPESISTAKADEIDGGEKKANNPTEEHHASAHDEADEKARKEAIENAAVAAAAAADEKLANCQTIVDRLRVPLAMYMAEAVIQEVQVLPAPAGFSQLPAAPPSSSIDRLPRPYMNSDSQVRPLGGVMNGAVGPLPPPQGESGNPVRPAAPAAHAAITVATPVEGGGEFRRFGFTSMGASV